MAAASLQGPGGNSALSGIPGLVTGQYSVPASTYLNQGLSLPTTNYGFQLIPSSVIQANQGQMINPNLATTTGAQLIPTSLAAQLAGTQFNQDIANQQGNVQQQQVQNAQDMGNVGAWWQQILGAQNQAATQGAQIGQSVASGDQNAMASILASLGGAANPAASSVASTGQNDLGTLQAINAINQAYNANMTPILQMGAAGALSQQQTQNNNNLNQQRQALADLIAQKGAAQVQDQFNILQQNNATKQAQQSALLNILSANNTTRGNNAQLVENAIAANNQTRGNIASLNSAATEWAQSMALQGRSLNDQEKQTLLGVLMAGGYTVNPKTGMEVMAPQTAQAIHTLYPQIPASSLVGADASSVASIVKTGMADTTKTYDTRLTAGERWAQNLYTQGQDNSRNANTVTGELSREQLVQSGDNSRLVAKLDGADSQLSKNSPYLINGYGQIMTNSAGQPMRNTAYQGGTTGILTQSQADKQVESWVSGTAQRVLDPTTNKWTMEQVGGNASWQDAMAQASAYKSNPTEYNRIMTAIKSNPYYQTPGTNGVPYPKMTPDAVKSAVTGFQFAMSPKGGSMTPDAAILAAIQSGMYPKSVISMAVRRVFGSAGAAYAQSIRQQYPGPNGSGGSVHK